MPEEQLGFALGEASPKARSEFDPDDIRQDARGIIAAARAAALDGSWSPDELRYRRLMFPLLVSWIPDEGERAQLCFEFEQEAARVELRIAA